ncbi:MAG: hypothetical protein Q9174_004698 [Haloplaca sp. 1 TL-2023]
MKWPLGKTRGISISCHGKKISEAKLYEYTNGRFLHDEKRQLASRHLKFDLTNLCNEACRVTNGSTVQNIEKMEGGFSKALLMTMSNGKEIIAKLPCPNAGRSMYSTASEAAVLEYLSVQTQVPTPKLLSWSADAAGPVGAEYIIMEKAPGIQLFSVWDEISASARLKLIKSLTQLENQLATIQFPAYGSLYHRRSINKSAERVLLDPSIDPDGQYCVGPSCGPKWTDGYNGADLDPELDMGPFEGLDLHQYGSALSSRSVARTRIPATRVMTPNLQGAPRDHTDLRDAAMTLLPHLVELPVVQQYAKPVLWHTDLHMGNIFVSETDHSQIVSIIDWQHTSISPHFVQARWPVFLRPPEDYAMGLQHPELPKNYEELDDDDKANAKYEKKKADASKAYEVATYLNNEATYEALWEIHEPTREFFRRIGGTWDDGVVPVQRCVQKICEDWSKLGSPNPCPVSISDKDMEAFRQRCKEYLDWIEVQEVAKKSLDTDDDGWISPEFDFDAKCQQNKEFLRLLDEQSSTEEGARITKRFWPFPV